MDVFLVVVFASIFELSELQKDLEIHLCTTSSEHNTSISGLTV